MTWLYLVNVIIFQWFFVRLTKMVDKDTKKVLAWGFQGFVVPLTGWSTKFIYISKWFIWFYDRR